MASFGIMAFMDSLPFEVYSFRKSRAWGHAELFTFLGCISRFRTETAPLCTSPGTRLNLEQQKREGGFSMTLVLD